MMVNIYIICSCTDGWCC